MENWCGSCKKYGNLQKLRGKIIEIKVFTLKNQRWKLSENLCGNLLKSAGKSSWNTLPKKKTAWENAGKSTWEIIKIEKIAVKIIEGKLQKNQGKKYVSVENRSVNNQRIAS